MNIIHYESMSIVNFYPDIEATNVTALQTYIMNFKHDPCDDVKCT